MYMAKASSIFRTLSNLKFPLERVVFGVNNEIIEAKFKGMFVTAVFGKFNVETGDVTFVNAGHESIMVFDRSKNFERQKYLGINFFERLQQVLFLLKVLLLFEDFEEQFYFPLKT